MKVTINAGKIGSVSGLGMTQEQLKQEVAATLDAMRMADDSQREYSIGALSALLWVQGGGELARSTAFVQACQAWDKMREGVTNG